MATIEANGDKTKEADELFYVDLFGNSADSLLVKNGGIGTILNDDERAKAPSFSSGVRPTSGFEVTW